MEQTPFAATEYIELFFELFDVSTDVVFIIRLRDGVLLDANQASLSMFGLERKEAIGHATLDLGIWVNPGDRGDFAEAVRTKGKVRDRPTRFRNRWSDEFTLKLSGMLIRLRGEEAILGIGVLSRPG